MSIRVTLENTVTGETATRVIDDDVIVVTAGSHYVDGIQEYANGTRIYTVKVDKLVSQPATPGYEITRSEVTKLYYALGLDPREVVELHIHKNRADATHRNGTVVSVRIKETRKP